MAFGSLGPTMFDNTSMGNVMPMMMQMLRQNQGAAPSNAQQPMPQPSNSQQLASPGILNNMLGMKPGMGLLNSLFQKQQAAPMNILPTIPPADDNSPGPNALTGMW